MIDATTLKANYRVPDAWRDLALPGEPAKNCRSPFTAEHRHGDATPSFSVYDEGRRWKDHATGAGGDVFDFVAKVLGAGKAEAFTFVRERSGLRSPLPPSQPVHPPPARSRRIPPLDPGTPSDRAQLNAHRGFGDAGLLLAQERGLLHFAELFGFRAWCVTDQRRELCEFRRLDDEKWPAMGSLAARKSHALGTGKSWPIGTLESLPFPKVVLVEGAPDLLAAFHFIAVEGKADTVTAVAALGASNHRLSQEALRHFADKQVRLFPHLDPAGRQASRIWAKSLVEAGAARVDAFDLSALHRKDGMPGKDLADVTLIDPDCFETHRKFHALMP